MVRNVSESDGGISRGAEGKLGIVKARLGMMLGKMLVRIGHGRAHRKLRTWDLARDKCEILTRHGVE